jgi:4-hydroxy-tetrahydrodipicolinate reductase
MKILLLGYGKMGKAIEQRALLRGHSISARINSAQEREAYQNEAEVAIEFSEPGSAIENLRWCLKKGLPVVCGTTGWLEQKPAIEEEFLRQHGAFFYAANYSLGVNLFFKLNEALAQLMNQAPGYKLSMEEEHHTEKKDSPSGTALALARQIIALHKSYHSWQEGTTAQTGILPIHVKRTSGVPGTHILRYQSEMDEIEIKHTAFSREGFADGAITAAEWLVGRQGVFSMNDLMDFK